MRLAKIINGKVVRYPYTISELRFENSNVSFPANLEGKSLDEFNAYEVMTTEMPEVDYTQKVEESTPVCEDGVWKQSWSIVDLSEEEIQKYIDSKAEEARQKRNELLTASDWTQIPDSSANTAIWKTYRQKLRDISNQKGFPLAIIWPNTPE